jgi:hypothetical protein
LRVVAVVHHFLAYATSIGANLDNHPRTEQMLLATEELEELLVMADRANGRQELRVEVLAPGGMQVAIVRKASTFVDYPHQS